MKNLKILLVMPYFERPNLVVNALRSMQNINYDNYEIYIVDDGSVRDPIESVIEANGFEIENLTILNTNDTEEQKAKRGSIHNSFINQAIKQSDADIGVYISDDDAVRSDYFQELNDYYQKNPDKMYSYAHIIQFDPHTQVPCETLKIYNKGKNFKTKAPWRLNYTHDLNPQGKVDATQVSWRIECNKKHDIWLIPDLTRCADSFFFKELYDKFGPCTYNGLTGVFKAFHPDQLSNRWGEQTFKISDVNAKPNYLSICTNFRDEADNLKEWLDYHISVGVDHFFLYNNNSKDNYKDVLSPYISAGLVTLTSIGIEPIKPIAVEHYFLNHKFKTHWVAFMDCDEYLTAPDGDSMFEILKKFEKYPALGINQLMFGTSGLEDNPDKSIVKNFTRCENPLEMKEDSESRIIKSIVNPRKVAKIRNRFYVNPHYFKYDKTFLDGKEPYAVNTDGACLKGAFSKKVNMHEYAMVETSDICLDKLFYRHYYLKSTSEFLNRKFLIPMDDRPGKRFETQEEAVKFLEEKDKIFSKIEYKELISKIKTLKSKS